MSEIVKTLLKDVGVDFGVEDPKHNTGNVAFLKEKNEQQRIKQRKRQKKLLAEAKKKSGQISDIKSSETNHKIQSLLKDVGVNFGTEEPKIIIETKEEMLEKIRLIEEKQVKLKIRNKVLTEEIKLKQIIFEEKFPQKDIVESKTPKLLKEIGVDFEPRKIITEKIEKVKEIIEEETLIEEGTLIEEEDIIDVDNMISSATEYITYQKSKEPLIEISPLREELDLFKKHIMEQVFRNTSAAVGNLSGAGSGEVRLEFLDDIDTTSRTHKSIIMYNDVTGKYEVADPDLDAGISNEDDSGDEIILNATTSGGADESSSIQQENNTRMAAGATTNTTVSSLTFSTPTITLTDSASDTVTLDLSNSIDGTMIALGSDASGDVMYYNGTNYIRLARGSDDEVLTLASGAPSWAAAGGGGAALTGSTNNTITTVTGANAFQGEANLTFDGSTLAVTGAITGTTDLTLGDDLILDSDSAVIQFGDDQEIKLTHVHNTGLSITSTAAAPLVRRGEDVFIVLNQTAAAGTDAGDNVIMDRSASDGTDAGDDIIGEDQVFLHSGMQRDVINIVDSAGTIKKSIAGFSAGTI